MPDLIVLVPGIMGSVLKRHGKVVWGYSAGTIGKALVTQGRSLQRELALPHDDPDVDDLGDGVVADQLMPDLHLLPGLWKIDGYAAIANTLVEQFDVAAGANLRYFPYDWRRDNRNAAKRLQRAVTTWLGDWRRQSPDAKVIFLAHSMGGLVCRYYLECLGGAATCRALMTFGTPYRGSLNAVNTLANGLRTFGIDLSPVARQFTAIYQLLPTYACIDAGAGPVKVTAAAVPNIDPQRAAAAAAFHEAIAGAVAANRATPSFEPYLLQPIVGINQDTLEAATVGAGGVTMRGALGAAPIFGDGTVPRVSAIPVERSGAKEAFSAMYVAAKHGSLQNTSAVLGNMIGALSGLALDLGAFKATRQNVALGLPDLVNTGEPIEVRVRVPAPRVELKVSLAAPGTGPVEIRHLTSDRDGLAITEFPPRPEGAYTVTVEGPAVETIADAVAIVDPRE